jgi:hypothetical protein
LTSHFLVGVFYSAHLCVTIHRKDTAHSEYGIELEALPESFKLPRMVMGAVELRNESFLVGKWTPVGSVCLQKGSKQAGFRNLVGHMTHANWIDVRARSLDMYLVYRKPPTT